MSFVWFLIVFTVFGVTKSHVNQCNNPVLNEKCICSKIFTNSEELFTVNCTNQGFNNTSVLENLPEQIQQLIFVGNHIPVLDSNVFGDSDLSSLKYIDMTNNGIREIKGKAFHHVNNVERLILDHNNIIISNEDHHPRVFSNFYNLEELHLTNAFADNTDANLAQNLHDIFVNSNLTKLYKLHLEQNEIKYFKDENVFCDLPNLHDIYIADNNIPNLNFNIKCLKLLRYLDLENNNITKFSQTDLDKFDKLAQPYRATNLIININGNPFRCDQAIKNLYNWLLKTNVEVIHKDKLECHQAKYGNKYILNLKNLAEAKHNKIKQALIILLLCLMTILVVLLTIYIYYAKKNKFRTQLSPIFEAITRKVRYTTIESQDV